METKIDFTSNLYNPTIGDVKRLRERLEKLDAETLKAYREYYNSKLSISLHRYISHLIYRKSTRRERVDEWHF